MRPPFFIRAAVFAAVASLPGSAHAGPGSDHSHDAPAPVVGGNNPSRQPDRSVFLPKPSQRLLAIRTILAERTEVTETVSLSGRVVMDPAAGGKVQPTIAGRIEAGPAGLPSLGAKVRRGDVLAHVQPSATAFDRATQTAQAAELRSSLDLARRRLTRLEQLQGSVSAREVEAVRSEVQSLTERLAAVERGLGARETLTAPIDGVVATANVMAGQVVDAREVLFEIVDPTRVRIEALAYDPSLPARVGRGSLALKGERVLTLEFVGAARTLREGALPMHFATRVEPGLAPDLAIGQRVRIVVQTRERMTGFPLPAASLAKDPSNQDVVWVHDAAERFVPRVVRHKPLDGVTVAVVDGLSPGDRVVVDGASLINQIR